MNFIRLFPLCILPIALFSLAAPPPKVPEWSVEHSQLTKPPAGKGITLGQMTIVLEETPMVQVQQTFGGKIEHQGDAGDSLYWLCYTLPGLNQRLWLTSNEMGGGDVVNQIYATTTQQAADANCPAPQSAISQAPVLDNGLWLGMTQGEVSSLFGKPSVRKGKWQTYVQWQQLPGECQGKQVMYDLINSVSVAIENGRVRTLSAGKVTSY